jgi:hypothetical protein
MKKYSNVLKALGFLLLAFLVYELKADVGQEIAPLSSAEELNEQPLRNIRYTLVLEPSADGCLGF